jgi:hypothetical protein
MNVVTLCNPFTLNKGYTADPKIRRNYQEAMKWELECFIWPILNQINRPKGGKLIEKCWMFNEKEIAHSKQCWRPWATQRFLVLIS